MNKFERGWNFCIWVCYKVVRLFCKSICVFKQVTEKILQLFFENNSSFYFGKWVCSAWPIEQNWAFIFLIINSHWTTATLCSIQGTTLLMAKQLPSGRKTSLWLWKQQKGAFAHPFIVSWIHFFVYFHFLFGFCCFWLTLHLSKGFYCCNAFNIVTG